MPGKKSERRKKSEPGKKSEPRKKIEPKKRATISTTTVPMVASY
jgi:hypothetical protein